MSSFTNSSASPSQAHKILRRGARLLLVLTALSSLSACVCYPPRGGGRYYDDRGHGPGRHGYGPTSGGGAVVGGVVGGVIGHAVEPGVGTAIGVVGGAIIGNEIERSGRR